MPTCCAFPIAAALLPLVALTGAAQNEQRFVGRLTFRDTKVSSLAISADGKYVVWGFASGTLSIVEPVPGKTVMIEAFPAHLKPVSNTVFSADGKWLASAGLEGTVKIWDSALINKYQNDCVNRKDGTAKPPFPQPKKGFQAHSGAVYGLSFNPDGKMLATSGADGTVKVWNLDVGKLAYSIAAHKGTVHAVAFSPDGELIATAGADRLAKIWKSAAPSKQPVQTLAGHDGAVLALAFSPDGKQLATGSGVPKKSGQIRVWDVASGKEEFKISDLIGDMVTTVCFHPTLPRLISGGKDKKIRVFSLTSKKQLYSDDHVDALIKVAITADGNRLGTVCADEAKYWAGSPKIAE